MKNDDKVLNQFEKSRRFLLGLIDDVRKETSTMRWAQKKARNPNLNREEVNRNRRLLRALMTLNRNYCDLSLVAIFGPSQPEKGGPNE
jgi:hypothetical protein